MAEDDDVDVMGDFSYELFNKPDSFDDTPLVSQNSDLLNCEYTVHPQWLLDKPSTNPALWYSTPDLHGETTKQYENEPQSDLSIHNAITDESGWTEKEKDLLNRGIEIFGKSNVNLSQFIGSRTAAEVKYFLKNFFSEPKLTVTRVNEEILFDEMPFADNEAEFLDEHQIPASIEEIIEGDSPSSKTRRKDGHKKKKNTPNPDNCHTYSYKTDSMEKCRKKVGKIKIKLNANQNILKNKNAVLAKVRKRRNNAEDIAPKLKHESIVEINKLSVENVDIQKDLRINTGHGNGVKVCEGEEVVKIIKENEGETSESEIDIEEGEDCDNLKITANESVVKASSEKNENQENGLKDTIEITTIEEKQNERIVKSGVLIIRKSPHLEDLDKETVEELQSMEYPQNEICIVRDFVSSVEKFLFYEFFEGRQAKTPARYLHIRNHILEKWKAMKPKYVRKTFIRNGLKQAGDVNLVGRIHTYLEQVGAINFGCEQTNYMRPLSDLIPTPSIPKEKGLLKLSSTCESLSRARLKKKLLSDGEGGYTLTHDEKGDIVNTTVVKKESTKQRSFMKKPSIRLIYCRPFTDEYPQKYTINLDISTLILMDLHSHMHLTEVMGLIGGYWNPSCKQLIITRYIPCKNIASSLTHCDMCPISQSRAANQLLFEKLDILGWYHSHPTFAPEPSHQDIETQLSVQQWIGSDIPCIGFILSPFSAHGALIASPFRCMMVEKREEQVMPFKFKVNLISQRVDVQRLLCFAQEIVGHAAQARSMSRVDFMKAYFQNSTISHLDKFIYSVKLHLAKCANVNKMTCDAITEGLVQICRSTLTSRT